jgi:signal transduction histidine kinase
MRLTLSLKLLIASLVFGLVLQMVSLIPTLATYREQWLSERLQTAQLASLAVEAARGGPVSGGLASELLQNAGVKSVALKRNGRRTLVVQARDLKRPPHLVDLRDYTPLQSMADTTFALFAGPDDMLRVVARPRYQAGEFIEIVVSARLLRSDLWAYAQRMAGTGALLSAATALLIYLSLSALFVRPMLRLNTAMQRFRNAPEDASSLLTPSTRSDEIGAAEVELARLQAEVQTALSERRRLATLGTAVAKIAHDLRNMLSAAQLSVERLLASSDPSIAAPAQRLARSIDRAVALAEATLSYGKAEEPAPQEQTIALSALLLEAAEDAGLNASCDMVLNLAVDATITADPDQMRRVFVNLIKNARQAGATQITVTTTEGGIVVEDNGPGIPARVQDCLFDPFVGQGTGLGLAIARELAALNGFELRLAHTSSAGTGFILKPNVEA